MGESCSKDDNKNNDLNQVHKKQIYKEHYENIDGHSDYQVNRHLSHRVKLIQVSQMPENYKKYKLSSYSKQVQVKVPYFVPEFNLSASKIQNFDKQLVAHSLQDLNNQQRNLQRQLCYSAQLLTANAHIIDNFDLKTTKQTHLKYKIIKKPNSSSHNTDISQEIVIVKVYRFQHDNDIIIRNAIYELYLYNLLKQQKRASWLRHCFLIQKGQVKSLVYIFRSYLCTLFDILQYRQAHNYHYSNDQQIFIAHQLIRNYHTLSINKIAHRDIRPSKVYLFDPFSKNVKEHQEYSSPSYQFLNLQSSRQITQNQYIQFYQQNRLLNLSPRGVPHYAIKQIKDELKENNKRTYYDFELSDRTQLANLLTCLVTLNPYQNCSQFKIVRKKNKQLSRIIDKLLDIQINNIDSILQNTAKLVKNIKVRTINCPKILKYQLTNKPNGILTSDFDIATGPLNKQILQHNSKKFQDIQIQTMLSLCQQNIYLPILHQKIQTNYQLMQQQQRQTYNCLINNIYLLHQLGIHFKNIGVIHNDYIRQQVNLILKLCQLLRTYGYDTSKQIKTANTLFYMNLSYKMRTSITKAYIIIQNAYMLLLSGEKSKALKQINKIQIPIDPYEGGYKFYRKLPDIVKLDCLEARSILEAQNKQYQRYELYIEQGLQICRQTKKRRYQARLYYFLAKYQHKQILDDQVKKQNLKILNKIQENVNISKKYLQKSAQGDQDIIISSSIHQLRGDISSSRQSYQQALKQYKNSYCLLQTAELPVSQNKKTKILNKMSQLLQKHEFSYQERIWIQKRAVLNLAAQNLMQPDFNSFQVASQEQIPHIQLPEIENQKKYTVQSNDIDQEADKLIIKTQKQMFPLRSNQYKQKIERNNQSNNIENDGEYTKKKRITRSRLSLLY